MHTISPILVRQEFARRPRFARTLMLGIAAVGLRAATGLLVWQERQRDRHRLASLDDRLLRDVGLSRADVEGEISKRFWQG
jgi:uncharacterized protein YjiS (DUF1127 family)